MDNYLSELAGIIEESYGIHVTGIEAAPRGFFGETWFVRTEEQKYLLKINFWKDFKDEYEKSFPVMERLLENGIDFIPEVIKGKNGELYFHFHDGILGMFEFAEGVNDMEYPLKELFGRLAKVYRIRTEGLELKRETYSDAIIEECRNLAEQLDVTDATEAGALQLLKEKEECLTEYAKRVRLFSEKCRKEATPLCITHGDGGGNCVCHEQSFKIIDWDTVMLAPPERDTWCFMHRDHQVKEIEQAFADQGFPYKLSFSKFGYYCYSMYFYYIVVYLKVILDSAGEKKEKLLEAFSDYFTSWITEQLQFAEKLLS